MTFASRSICAAVERQGLAHLARRAPAAIGNHVGRHRRAVLAVLLVDVLDHALAAIAARQVEIDVGPLAALLRQEPLEQQIHPDRIHRRDPEAVADGAVGGRAAPLHEDVLLPAEIDDVPDDEEIAGEIELLDEVQLARDLGARAIVIRPVPFAGARLRDLAQERRHRLARRHRVLRKAVAEIRHRVLEPIRQRARAGDGLRQIAEEPRHGVGRLEIALGVPAQTPPGMLERRLVTDAGEHVVERPIGDIGKAHAVAGDDRQVKGRREIAQRVIVGLFIAQQMALQLDADIRRAEGPDQTIDQAADAVARPVDDRAAGQRDEPADRAVELVERERALALGRRQLHARHEPAQILIALA